MCSGRRGVGSPCEGVSGVGWHCKLTRVRDSGQCTSRWDIREVYLIARGQSVAV